jgi:hypothetical protein
MAKLTREMIEQRIKESKMEGRQPMPKRINQTVPRMLSRMNAIIARRATFKTA